jgi:predicted O-linked N-acetylglucosamine transferase (SPINDLY family)
MLLKRERIDILVELVSNGNASRLIGPEKAVPVYLKVSSFSDIGQKTSDISTGFINEDSTAHVARLETSYLDKWLDWFVGQSIPRRRSGKRTAETVGRLIDEGRALRINGFLEEAEGNMVKAIHADPRNADAFINLGGVLVYQGKISEGIASFRRALAFDPHLIKARSNLLFVMNYSEKYSSREIYDASLLYQKMLGRTAKYDFSNNPDTNRRLRIGYISPDFCRHSVSYFFEPLLSNHDREKFEVYCYSCVERPDETTDRLKRVSSKWRECVGLEDDLIVKMIREDRIDILVDLAGHIATRIRLPVFSKRAAPVQVTWLGYPNTTGLSTIDYRITDSIADPDGISDRLHSERLVRLPYGFLCYRPETDAPEVRPAPADSNGFVTFGSFNMIPKLSDVTITVWSSILKAVPDSRLILKTYSLIDGLTRNRVAAAFSRQGIAPERINMVGAFLSVRDHLDLYGEMDIALDPFPYNGTTTTCEALWMGVPVLTFLGDRHAGRVGGSILRQLGLNELVAESIEDYVNRAIALTQSIELLNDYRRRLRPLMTGSTLCDGKLFAHLMEDAYRVMWLSWRQSQEINQVEKDGK